MPFLVTSSDQNVVSIDPKYAPSSRFLANLLEELGPTPTTDIAVTVPLSSQVLTKLVDFLHHDFLHPLSEASASLDEKTLRRFDLKSEAKLTDDWEIQYCKMDQLTLFEVIKGANYMGMTRCLDLLCKSVAMMIMGKSSEQIRELFGIQNDWTPEEEEKVREEIKWLIN